MNFRRSVAAASLVAMALSGCYIVPTQTADGRATYSHYPMPPIGGVMPVQGAGGVAPTVLNVRLYPINELATQSGIVTGTVTNMMTGKGKFQMSYMGEILTGEASRVSTEEKRGVATAYSPRGMYMSCEYQLNTPYQGAGTCSISNGARYQMHIGGN